jgi:hypothetical protein
MTEIKPGMVVAMKTTGDEMMVLSVGKPDGLHILAGYLSGVLAYVRRPIITEKGTIEYKLESFLVDELETKEEGLLRKAEELETLKAQFNKTRPEFTQVGGDKSTVSN